jgi:DNA ligase 1
MIKTFPTLYEKSSTGKTKQWTISVQELASIKDNPQALIRVNFGLTDSENMRATDKVIAEGKNIGRSNETTPYEQALSEAESTWKKKKDKGYVESLEDLDEEVLRPMLAHSFQKRKHNIAYPAYAQPKLDGVRCLAKKVDEDTVKYYSRMGKEFTTLEHLTPLLLAFMQVDDVMDGEIYSHDITFQEMIRLVKKQRPESVNLQYHIFDLIDTKLTFEERYAKLKRTIPVYNLIKLVKTKKISDEKEIKKLHDEYIKAGYEGIIVRNSKGLYKLNKRSADLQKYKEFKDEEFRITGGVRALGSENGCVIFYVKNKLGIKFAVRPRGSFEQRKKWLKDIDSIIGKYLTVRYQELTDDGLPRFPVGISIRDYES